MPKASTNRMIYNANYNKVGQCIYNKDLWNRPLLDFEWNRFHICQYLKKRSYMLYKTLLVLTVYSTTYFLQNCFFAFPKIRNAMLDFFKQVLPVGIAEVIFFATFSKNHKKAKREPTFFFLTNVSSLFFWYKKRASKWLRYTKLILLLTAQFYHIFIQKSMHFINKIKIHLKFMRFQQGITSVFGYNVQTDWRKISTI